MTLDGVFDADAEYFEQWFMPYHSDERAHRIQENVLGCGALLMGRETYDFLAPSWSDMGRGERFFRDGMSAGGLNLVESEALPLGVVALTYVPAET